MRTAPEHSVRTSGGFTAVVVLIGTSMGGTCLHAAAQARAERDLEVATHGHSRIVATGVGTAAGPQCDTFGEFVADVDPRPMAVAGPPSPAPLWSQDFAYAPAASASSVRVPAPAHLLAPPDARAPPLL